MDYSGKKGKKWKEDESRGDVTASWTRASVTKDEGSGRILAVIGADGN